jgi:hypothetical protein
VVSYAEFRWVREEDGSVKMGSTGLTPTEIETLLLDLAADLCARRTSFPEEETPALAVVIGARERETVDRLLLPGASPDLVLSREALAFRGRLIEATLRKGL